MTEPAPQLAVAAICDELARRGHRFALVGGLAVSVRAEVRFTRDVDLVVAVADDSEAESLIYELRSAGYTAVASIEHEARHRLATVRMMSPQGIKVDLLFAARSDPATPPERLAALEHIGKEFRAALDLPRKYGPDTLGRRAAWARSERAIHELCQLSGSEVSGLLATALVLWR